MLDRTTLLKAFEAYAPPFFTQMHEERRRGQRIWNKLVQDPELFARVCATDSSRLPHAQELACVSVSPAPPHYTAYSIDGSQIYPDRHAGVSCYVINIGCVAFTYGAEAQALFHSELFIHRGELADSITPELVNAHRSAYEFEVGVRWCGAGSGPALFFVDGSLIFWHLSAHEKTVQVQLMQRYLAALQELYLKKIPIVGYISLPQSKELLFCARAAQDLLPVDYHGSLEYIVDTDLLSSWLMPGQRTNLFEHRSSFMHHYPEQVRIYFFYLNVGEEIARVELPAWLVAQVDEVAALVYDQAQKGRGYPVALAEAHQQAVVTEVDRLFFYHLVSRKSQEHGSQKAAKKRLLDM